MFTHRNESLYIHDLLDAPFLQMYFGYPSSSNMLNSETFFLNLKCSDTSNTSKFLEDLRIPPSTSEISKTRGNSYRLPSTNAYSNKPHRGK